MRFAILLCAITLAACQGVQFGDDQPVSVDSKPTATPKVASTPKPVAKPTATPAVSASVPKVPGFKEAWVKHTLKVLETEFPKLDKAAKDMARFCPNYSKLSTDGKKAAFLHLFSGVLKYESGVGSDGYFKTSSSMVESNAAISQGLFQLTYGDAFCPKKKSEGDLNDPLVNITCGVKIFANFTSKDGVIAAGGYTAYGASPAKGAARYWSVLRVKDSKSAHKLPEIIAIAKKAPGC